MVVVESLIISQQQQAYAAGRQNIIAFIASKERYFRHLTFT
ncbi:MAG: hypothetical protein WA421_10485 [Nitrososphaeraceae archaeon]|jgi:hypothetical protein